jgi:sec-independent protein translocase protein TatA
MPTIGPLELIIILVIALIIIGPGRLPDVGAALGKSIRDFRKASSDVAEATRSDAAPPAGTAPAAPTAAPAPPPSPEAAPTVSAPAVPPTPPSDQAPRPES